MLKDMGGGVCRPYLYVLRIFNDCLDYLVFWISALKMDILVDYGAGDAVDLVFVGQLRELAGFDHIGCDPGRGQR